MSDEDIIGDVNIKNAPRNIVEDDHVTEADVLIESPREPSSTIVQGESSTKNISAIRGWKKEEILVAIDDIEFNGYSIWASAKKTRYSSLINTLLDKWIDSYKT